MKEIESTLEQEREEKGAFSARAQSLEEQKNEIQNHLKAYKKGLAKLQKDNEVLKQERDSNRQSQQTEITFDKVEREKAERKVNELEKELESQKEQRRRSFAKKEIRVWQRNGVLIALAIFLVFALPPILHATNAITIPRVDDILGSENRSWASSLLIVFIGAIPQLFGFRLLYQRLFDENHRKSRMERINYPDDMN